MIKVSVPYTEQDGKLIMQQIAWPQQCPCCRSSDVSGEYALTHQLNKSVQSYGTQSRTTFYPLAWVVPYCPDCLDHAGSGTFAGLAGFGVWLIVTLILAFTLYKPLSGLSSAVRVLGWVLIIGLPILPGWIAFKLVYRRTVEPKVKPECATQGWAVSVESGEGQIIFAFDDDAYGEQFAALNGRAVG